MLETMLDEAEHYFEAAGRTLPNPSDAAVETDPASMSEESGFCCPQPTTLHNRQRYLDDLDDFGGMLDHHIKRLRELRVSKLSVRNKDAGGTVSFAPYMHPGFKMNIERGGWQKPKMSTDERLERIHKGRARGWKSERFDAARYEKLCDAALSELPVHSKFR